MSETEVIDADPATQEGTGDPGTHMDRVDREAAEAAQQSQRDVTPAGDLPEQEHDTE